MLPSPGDHVLACKQRRVGIKSALIEYAAMQRSLVVTRHNRATVVLTTPTGGAIPFRQMNGPLSSAVGMTFCHRKDLGRKRLNAAGLSTTPSELFGRREFNKAWAFAVAVNGSVVVKPTDLSRGKGITTQVETKEQFHNAWDKAFGAYRGSGRRQVLVEQHFRGEDFRFYVIADRVIAATHRKRAHVVGDGTSNLAELIDEKNANRAQNPYLGDYLLPNALTELDRVTSLDYVPAANEEVILRGTSNLSAGGDSIDVTDDVHPGFHDVAVRALAAIPGMEYAGVDIIAPSIAEAPSEANHIVSEAEFSPAPITHFPSAGPFRDMAGQLVDFYLERYP